MTPKEKAIEFVSMFQGAIETPLTLGLKFEDAKYCALIAVDEILLLLPEIAFGANVFEYWQQVRNEIENF